MTLPFIFVYSGEFFATPFFEVEMSEGEFEFVSVFEVGEFFIGEGGGHFILVVVFSVFEKYPGDNFVFHGYGLG